MNIRQLVLSLFSLIPLFIYQACGTKDGAQGELISQGIADQVSYNFHVRPILSDNCYACHGPDANKREADLRLDIEDEAFGALKDNPDAHAIVPGKAENSEVYRRLISDDPSIKMPPPESNLSLNEREIETIKKWINQGAAYEPHWSFIPLKEVKLPTIEDSDWGINEIDRFILQAQLENGFQPNPEADKESLLKRLSFDLTGLPPDLELMDAFLANENGATYEQIIEQLLTSPAYGEKMAVYWMDIARFADSHGFQDDSYRSQWPWRDWVIHAFNTNMSYDQFITWQIAGDLLPNPTKEQLLATGFNRNHKITEEGGIVDEEYRVMYVTDRTNTFGKALMGITMECATCHDHKYDPITQKDYYQLYSFFNNVQERGIESVVGGPETYAKKPFMHITDEDVRSILSFVNKKDTTELIVSIMGDMEESRNSYILERGSYEVHGEEVSAGTPESILSFDSGFEKNRLGLAKWLFDKNNPLTARVFVNQIWQEIFGRGIVATPGDFGMQGELPSHPDLLDWLAMDFMKNGWDVKHLVKKMVTSATYRQSAVLSEDKRNRDPENIFLTRAPRDRLKAEFIRNLILASSGLLNKEVGGPSVKHYQPSGLWEGATSGRGILSMYKQDHGGDLYRRGLYTFIKRTVPPPSMTLFDASNRDQCEVERLITNTPLQALVMLNDPTMLEASRVLAASLLKENSDATKKIEKAFRSIVCRYPEEKELLVLNKYYEGQLQTLSEEVASELLQVGEYPLDKSLDKLSLAAMMQVISTIYNLEESIAKT
ncbi:PSD1 and planctomycete cytochrome C domain-containing protein [Cyclobacterium amurskyense]|uniref:Cytochrome C n=1 Tax=Cyclobacterium amurskyense TaxID=320787 RepID=A0A0H4PKB2_9BACT|nr:PSD1 and planctomycete cytochrome C domain-containing protein [Cyclobacterium amurskyense]AKP53475.1 cytochrome C [Cyclobacterium amurskyense]